MNQWVEKFHEVVDFYPIASDDKIVDCAGGKHFMVVVTKKGKCYASGFQMYRAIDEIRHNADDNEDNPFEIRMPEGWKALNCWACDRYLNIWVLAEKADDPSVKQIWSCGGDYDMVGCGDRSAAPNWRKPIFPEGTYMKFISSQGMSAYGIDQNDEVWEWGDHKVTNESGG